jgi:hypothetical protein
MNNKRKDVEVKLEDGSTVKIYVVLPTAKTIQKADRYRAKAWTECIEDGIKTKDELAIIMEKRGIWTQEHKTKEEKIIKELTDCEKELYLGGGKKTALLSDGKNIAIRMRQLRNDLKNLYMDRIAMEQNTAESLSDNARFDYIVAYSTFYENGQSVYKDIDDYNEKSSDEIAFASATALAEMMYNFNPKGDEVLPENQWLKKYDLVDENLSLINEDKVLVDLDGRTINELGYYINSDGERIDKEGNLLDENGNYVIKVDYGKPNTRKRPGKTTKTRAKTES